MSANMTPPGCGSNLDSLYFNLCDLSAAWGIVLEAFASLGLVFTFVLFGSLLGSLPFITDKNQRSSVALHAWILVFTFGLFGLTFAFIVGEDFSTCSSRRFLFGVLFGGCFSFFLMQAVRLNFLSRRNSAPRPWLLFLGAVGLWLVEVIINTEWLIITVVRHPMPPLNATAPTDRSAATPCNIANQDFVMALIYVMVLILAVVVASAAAIAGEHRRWRRESGCIFLSGTLSVGIWVAWIVMYIHGNEKHGGPTWDDPTLSIALVTNAWTFIIIYTIPEVCCWTSSDENQQSFGEELYANRGVGYENILKEHSGQSIFMENKGFSLDEPSHGRSEKKKFEDNSKIRNNYCRIARK